MDEMDLINISLIVKRNLHLFASSCYMISYNLLEDVLNKKINGNPIIDSYYQKYISLINENISSDDMIFCSPIPDIFIVISFAKY